MSNPVFNRLERDWRSQGGSATSVADRPGAAYNPEAFAQAQAAYYQPAYQPEGTTQAARPTSPRQSGPAVQTDRMTYDDVIVKTGLSLATLTVGAFASWMITVADPSIGMVLMMGGLIVGLVLAMVNIFSKKIRPAMVLAYSAAQGVALGALSSITEMMLPGVVLQAVVATIAVFGITLLLFTSGKVRNSPKLMKFALISLLGILGSRILIWLLGAFGVSAMQAGGQNITFLGIPLPVFISLFAVVVGAICLIGDFDQVRVGVEQGAPAKYAWASAFGIMVTVVWLYVEILNILSSLYARS